MLYNLLRNNVSNRDNCEFLQTNLEEVILDSDTNLKVRNQRQM